MKIVQIVGLLLIFPIWISTWVLIPRVMGNLFESMYTSNKEIWRNEGEPWAIFSWEPPEGRSASGNIAGTILAIQLAFATPNWLPLVSEGNSFQKKLRIYLFIDFAAAIAIFSLLLSLGS
ncbi:hypothetical protein [Geothrix limicola]|uniref:hypothetical protein n=1 Tax=Geothrix limicola TaxID=2927978 RepID=UPI002556CAC9|nr:hypothetical protein [Geothrix limicola]